MKRILIPLLFSLIFIFVLALSPASATTITIGDIHSENAVNATIMINDVIDVAAATINLSYDPSVIVVTAAENSAFDIFEPNLIFADEGWVKMTAFNIVGSMNGDVKFAKLTIAPRGSYGQHSKLNMDVELLNSSGKPIDATVINGSFCIGIPGPPIASFTYSPQNPVVNETITFNASNSIDPCGFIAHYEWDFGDSNITDTTEEIIMHSYALAGDYTVNLTVTDDDGATDSVNKTIIVVFVDTFPPASITNLRNTTGTTWINWAWDNPADADFNHTMVYLNGFFQPNVPNTSDYFNATGLDEDTYYTISTHTVDTSGNINTTWVNQTTKTKAVSLPVHNLNTGENFATIQAAIDDPETKDGHTIIVDAGTYNENVDVNKRLTIRSENDSASTTVQASNSNDHVFEVTVDWVNISGFTVTGATGKAGIYLDSAAHCNISDNNASNTYGIKLSYSNNNTLTNNTASNNDDGIYLRSSSSNTLTNNTANSNSDYGIYLVWSSDNTLQSNTANSNKLGIRLEQSSNNKLTNNTMSVNTYNFDVSGGIGRLWQYIHDIDTSNLVDGKPIYYWVNQQDLQVPSDAGFVGVVNSANITVKDLTLTNNSNGVLFVNTSDSRIENVSTSNCGTGIRLEFSSGNEFCNNNVTNNGIGIALSYSSGNEFCNNSITNGSSYGVYLYYSGGSILTDNAANSNRYNFVVLGGSLSDFVNDIGTSNTVDGKPIYYWVTEANRQIPSDAGYVAAVNSTNITVKNLILKNNGNGILLAYTKNSYVENISTSNCREGIALRYSSNNTLCNNSNTNNEQGIILVVSNNNTLCNNSNTNNTAYGIHLHYSNGNTLYSNSATNNNRYGIRLRDSNNNTLENNIANSNGGGWWCYGGIYLLWSNNNTLTTNIASSNSGHGIALDDADNNNISCNWVAHNKQYGVLLGLYRDGSTGNTIGHNNIMMNGELQTDSSYHWNFYNTQPDSVTAKYNYWGTGNSTIIAESIYDKSDDPSKGAVDFEPFLTEPAPCAPGPKPEPPSITSFAPTSPVNDTICNWRTFNVTVNQEVNVSWYLNGSFLFTNESVTEANCRLHAEVAGEHNVSAVASNENGTAMQTWIWNIQQLLCGDVAPYPDGNGMVNMGDVVRLLNHVVNPGEFPVDSWAGDCKCTDVINMGDVVLLLNHVSKPDEFPLECC